MSNGQGEGHAATGGGRAHTVGAHYDSLEQEYSSSKLGMWLFLATEILLFAGLFVSYAVFRSNHPDLFAWGSHFLDRNMGGLNTIILIASSFTFAWGVRAAQLGQRKLLITLLSLTLLGGAGFLTVKFFEYKPKFEHGLLWGTLYAPDPHYVAEHFGVELEAEESSDEASAAHAGDATAGAEHFKTTCAACHGRRGEGIAKQGLPLRTSTFVRDRDDKALLDFVKVGRQPFDPVNTTGVGMPPRGGNPILTDEKILDTIAYVRILQSEAAEEMVADSAGATVEAGEASGAAVAEEEFWIPKSVLPRASVGPSGFAPTELEAVHHAELVQERGHQFFGIYFLLTGLHGLHVIIGMIVIGWLLVRTIRGDFSTDYFGPVDLGGLYWHLVDIIWIFLFPLLYLI